MKFWNELSLFQKIPIGVLFLSLIILIPEAAFLVDAGGIDFILIMLFIYVQNIRIWIDLHFGFLKYPMIETKVFVKYASFTSVLFWLTSSFIFSSGFFLLLMFLKKDI